MPCCHRTTRGAFSEISKLVLEFSHAASGYSSLVLCLEDRLAGCVCFAFNNQDRKPDGRRSLGRIGAKHLLLLQVFQEIADINFVEASRRQCFDYGGVVKASCDIWTRSFNVENVLFR